jgi:dipeptidyl aminopeptidase/acylaminoacyl peptidase
LAIPIGADEAMLAAASPVQHAAAIKVPVLLVHGEQDMVVAIEQSELMAKALTATGRAPRFVRRPNADHGGWDADTALTYYKEVVAFLETAIPAPK